MKRLIILLCLFYGHAVWAIEDTPENRIIEATRYLEVAPPSEMVDLIAKQVVYQFPEDIRDEFRLEFQRQVDVDLLSESMKAAMVDVYTADELRALSDFQSTSVGKSAMLKSVEFTNALMPVMQEEMQRVVMILLNDDRFKTKDVLKAESIAQLKNYSVSVMIFYGEYGYYPEFMIDGNKDQAWVLDSMEKQVMFMEAFTGRDAKGERLASYGNKRALELCEFPEDDFNESGRITDRLGNQVLTFILDVDGDGKIDGRLNPKGDDDIRAKVLVFSNEASDSSNHIYTW